MLALCVGLLANFIEAAGDVSSIDAIWSAHPEARAGLAILIAIMVLHLGANLWAISALVQKKRRFKIAFVAFWILSILYPLRQFALLVVPDIMPDDVFDVVDVMRAAMAAIAQGIWFLYICLSVRVRNTLVN